MASCRSASEDSGCQAGGCCGILWASSWCLPPSSTQPRFSSLHQIVISSLDYLLWAFLRWASWSCRQSGAFGAGVKSGYLLPISKRALRCLESPGCFFQTKCLSFASSSSSENSYRPSFTGCPDAAPLLSCWSEQTSEAVAGSSAWAKITWSIPSPDPWSSLRLWLSPSSLSSLSSILALTSSLIESRCRVWNGPIDSNANLEEI